MKWNGSMVEGWWKATIIDTLTYRNDSFVCYRFQIKFLVHLVIEYVTCILIHHNWIWRTHHIRTPLVYVLAIMQNFLQNWRSLQECREKKKKLINFRPLNSSILSIPVLLVDGNKIRWLTTTAFPDLLDKHFLSNISNELGLWSQSTTHRDNPNSIRIPESVYHSLLDTLPIRRDSLNHTEALMACIHSSNAEKWGILKDNVLLLVTFRDILPERHVLQSIVMCRWL